jgi:hypothetical protein
VKRDHNMSSKGQTIFIHHLHASHTDVLALHRLILEVSPSSHSGVFAVPWLSDDYTDTPLRRLLLEESGACRMLEDLADSFPSAC